MWSGVLTSCRGCGNRPQFSHILWLFGMHDERTDVARTHERTAQVSRSAAWLPPPLTPDLMAAGLWRPCCAIGVNVVDRSSASERRRRRSSIFCSGCLRGGRVVGGLELAFERRDVVGRLLPPQAVWRSSKPSTPSQLDRQFEVSPRNRADCRCPATRSNCPLSSGPRISCRPMPLKGHGMRAASVLRSAFYVLRSTLTFTFGAGGVFFCHGGGKGVSLSISSSPFISFMGQRQRPSWSCRRLRP